MYITHPLALAALALLLPVVYALLVLTERVLTWRTWLRDVPGPPCNSFLLGNVGEFLRHDVVHVCLDWMQRYGGAVRFFGVLGVRVH